MIFISHCFAKENLHERLNSTIDTKKEATVNTLQNEVERLCLSLPEILPSELHMFLPQGAKGSSRDACLVLMCDTIVKENNVMPCIFEFILQRIQTEYELLKMERVKQNERTYWVVFISPQAKIEQESDVINEKIIPLESVTIWMDVTQSNQRYSIKERDEALQRASQIDNEITSIFGRIMDYESAESAANELKQLVCRFEKEMHIVILGTPDGETWELSIDNPKRSIIWDRLIDAHFFDSTNLYKVYTQICSCYISNSI